MALVANFQKLGRTVFLGGPKLLGEPSTFLYIDIIAVTLLLRYFRVDQSFSSLLEDS